MNQPQKSVKTKCKQECSKRVRYKVPIVWVLGGPGSGKGTQCDLIIEKHKFTHLSTGDLLRAEAKNDTERGKEVNEIMTKGELVSNEITLELLKDAMEKEAETATGFLIDGYPREKEQGKLFEKMITRVDCILFFDVSVKTLMDRLSNRAKSSDRTDDTPETIKNRIEIFKKNNDLVISEYKNRLNTINAEREIDEIFKDVDEIITALIKKKKGIEEILDPGQKCRKDQEDQKDQKDQENQKSKCESRNKMSHEQK